MTRAECQKRYAKSLKGKARRRAHARSKKHRRTVKKYQHGLKYKTYQKQYRHKYKKRLSGQIREWRNKNKLRMVFLIRRWNKKHPADSKSRHLKSSYGLSLGRFFEMIKAQSNRCMICGNKFKKTPFVDHNHKTGVVRGLLCRSCNLGIGFFKDSIPFLKTAIRYLRKSEKL